MKKRKTIYKLTAILLTVIYLHFFFMSPFFHYHSDEGTLENESILQHSHFASYLLNGNQVETGSHLEDSNEHEHFFKSNHINVILPGRDLLVSAVFLFHYSVTLEPSSQEETKTQFLSVVSYPSKELWERYVHTATNTSPPKA